MGKAPSPPNPVTTAQAQTDSNRQTAITQAGLNATNQITPYGNLTYDQIGTWEDGTPRYQATQSLSDGAQSLFNTGQQTQQNLANLAQQQSGRLSGLLNQNLDLSGLPSGGRAPGLSTMGGDTSGIATSFGQAGDIQSQLGDQDSWGQVQRVEDALFSRLNPQIDRQRQQMETDLANRGIRPGSTAYSQAMGDFNRDLNDQRTSVLLNAGQEQNRMQQVALNSGNFANNAQAQNFAQQAARGQFQNQAQNQLYTQQMGNAAFGNAASQQNYQNQNLDRQNALNEMLLQRQLPLNEILALSGQAQMQQPNFVSTPQTGVAGTDVAGITNGAYGQQMQAYNSNQGLMGGLFSAGASLIPLLSDIRVKTNIERVGTHPVGTGIYEYDRIDTGMREIGVIAQELQRIRPDMVDSTYPDGLLRVHYWKLNSEATRDNS
jgi:hypothetical protein